MIKFLRRIYNNSRQKIIKRLVKNVANYGKRPEDGGRLPNQFIKEPSEFCIEVIGQAGMGA